MAQPATLIMTTVASRAEADTISEALLRQRLAGCIQEIPITSRYRWQGEVAQESEILLLVKTTADAAERAMRAIEAVHDYEVPEVIAVPVTAGGTAYLEWLTGETGR